jgi:hypothetical protein
MGNNKQGSPLSDVGMNQLDEKMVVMRRGKACESARDVRDIAQKVSTSAISDII